MCSDFDDLMICYGDNIRSLWSMTGFNIGCVSRMRQLKVVQIRKELQACLDLLMDFKQTVSKWRSDMDLPDHDCTQLKRFCNSHQNYTRLPHQFVGPWHCRA